jgi:hypothetical protein
VVHQGYIQNVLTLMGFAVVYIFREGMNPEVGAHTLPLLLHWVLSKNDARSPTTPTILLIDGAPGQECGGLLIRRLLGQHTHTHTRTHCHDAHIRWHWQKLLARIESSTEFQIPETFDGVGEIECR